MPTSQAVVSTQSTGERKRMQQHGARALLVKSALIENRIKKIFDLAPFLKLLGVHFRGAGEGWVETELSKVESHHCQHDGFIHAGVVTTIADHTAGGAASTVLKDGQAVLTSSLHVNLLRPAPGNQSLRSIARILKAGRTQTVVESEVFSVSHATNKETLVGKATVQLAIINYTPTALASNSASSSSTSTSTSSSSSSSSSPS
eukprot:TRINITY_DN1328_c1_g1_i2.p1 TRINITY_DN1328_c1_g1~~TRINITY_DN1328_c1_g1_i2.p1  ORF type:complete len:203 (-),score=49.38 TRINITY_DN1328_c1_g1_i2:161-769(-)